MALSHGQESDKSTSRTATFVPAGVISIYQIIGLALSWTTAFKASRVLNTLFALELGAKPLETGLLLAMYGLHPLLFAAYASRLHPVHEAQSRNPKAEVA